MNSSHNYLIDFLRFFAATWVVLFHFNEVTVYQNNTYREIVKLGHLGVPIFFVISGYCIMLATEHTKKPIDFLIRRFFRIYPAFWASLLIVVLAVILNYILAEVNSVTVLPKNLIALIATVTLLTDPFSNIPTMNWVYWSLTYEIFFYIIIFIYLFIPMKLRFLWLLLITGLSILLSKHNHWLFFFTQHWPAFLLGISVYKINNGFRAKGYLKGSILLVFALICLFFPQTPKQLPYQITCILTSLLIYLNHFWPFKGNIISRLGDYSYSIYLIHIPVGVYILGFLKNSYGYEKNLFMNILWDLIAYLVVLIMARWIFNKIEKPYITYGKTLIKKLY